MMDAAQQCKGWPNLCAPADYIPNPSFRLQGIPTHNYSLVTLQRPAKISVLARCPLSWRILLPCPAHWQLSHTMAEIPLPGQRQPRAVPLGNPHEIPRPHPRPAAVAATAAVPSMPPPSTSLAARLGSSVGSGAASIAGDSTGRARTDSMTSAGRRRVAHLKLQLIQRNAVAPEVEDDAGSVSSSSALSAITSTHGTSLAQAIASRRRMAGQSLFALARRSRQRLQPQKQDLPSQMGTQIESSVLAADGTIRASFQRSEALVRTETRVVNGELVTVEVEVPAEDQDADAAVVHEVNESGTQHNTRSYMKRPPTRRWSAPETKLFYECLRTCGTEFSLMAEFFPSRDRRDMASKLKHEQRHRPQLVDAALAASTTLSLQALPTDSSLHTAQASSDENEPVPQLLDAAATQATEAAQETAAPPAQLATPSVPAESVEERHGPAATALPAAVVTGSPVPAARQATPRVQSSPVADWNAAASSDEENDYRGSAVHRTVTPNRTPALAAAGVASASPTQQHATPYRHASSAPRSHSVLSATLAPPESALRGSPSADLPVSQFAPPAIRRTRAREDDADSSPAPQKTSRHA